MNTKKNLVGTSAVIFSTLLLIAYSIPLPLFYFGYADLGYKVLKLLPL